MGQVYQATDTKLHREVALKVLPEAFAQDPDRLARFQREAQVLASLNHPNIGHIYGLEDSAGTTALVLELVEGPTLADRIAQGPIPVDEALPIAKQIAGALEAAHESGVIHRDLKPANIKLKTDGTVKVLDFGLAKAFQPEASDASASLSPTISLTAAATQMGMVIGTAAYMAPEQAKGLAVDKRADIWAYGAVLFEMLTGKKLFEAGDVSEMLASVLVKDPDISSLGNHVPAHIRSVVRKCLVKDPKKRLRDMGDVRLVMEGEFETGVAQTGKAAAVVASQPALWRRAVPYVASSMVVGLAVGLSLWPLIRDEPRSVVRFAVDLNGSLAQDGPGLVLSPDGTKLAYAAIGDDGQQRLFVRPLDQVDAVPIAGTEGATNLFWSPNGEWVGFQADQILKKVSLAGGSPVELCELAGLSSGASWGNDDTIIFGDFQSDREQSLWRVSAAGGIPEPFTTLDTDEGEDIHIWPQVLPGSDAVLFNVWDTSRQGLGTAVQSFSGSGHRVILEGGSARYMRTGHLVFTRPTPPLNVFPRAETLWAVPFDLAGC